MRKTWDDMDDDSEAPKTSRLRAMLRALQMTLPAVIGAAALTFLFAAVIPMAWVAGISWNLYLDRLSDLFVPPVGNGARLALALAMSAIAALIAAFVALLINEPEASGLTALRRRASRAVEEEASDYVPPRRRADLHPDDLPRAPIRAGRDLPAEGLGVWAAPTEASAEPDPFLSPAVPETADWSEVDELVLADLAPVEIDEPGAEPWLQPVASTGPALPDPADNSLGAMVARLELGLSRKRLPAAATLPIPVNDPVAGEESDAEIDFALEAALSTLQRMNRQTQG